MDTIAHHDNNNWLLLLMILLAWLTSALISVGQSRQLCNHQTDQAAAEMFGHDRTMKAWLHEKDELFDRRLLFTFFRG